MIITLYVVVLQGWTLLSNPFTHLVSHVKSKGVLPLKSIPSLQVGFSIYEHGIYVPLKKPVDLIQLVLQITGVPMKVPFLHAKVWFFVGSKVTVTFDVKFEAFYAPTTIKRSNFIIFEFKYLGFWGFGVLT